MRNLLSLSGVLLLIVMPAGTLSGRQDRDATYGARGRFIGAWRLAWLEEQGADGKIQRADRTGLLVYARDGHMSVRVMYRNPPAGPQKATGAPMQYAQGGYEASFGTYEIDERAHSFTFHVEGALVRSLYRQRPEAHIRPFGQTAHREVLKPG